MIKKKTLQIILAAGLIVVVATVFGLIWANSGPTTYSLTNPPVAGSENFDQVMITDIYRADDHPDANINDATVSELSATVNQICDGLKNYPESFTPAIVNATWGYTPLGNPFSFPVHAKVVITGAVLYVCSDMEGTAKTIGITNQDFQKFNVKEN